MTQSIWHYQFSNYIAYITVIHGQKINVLGSRDLYLPKTCGRVLDTTFKSMCAEVCVQSIWQVYHLNT